MTVAGFKSFEQTRIDLASSQVKRIDVKLEVGDVASTVTVEGGVSQVETEHYGRIFRIGYFGRTFDVIRPPA